MNPSSEQELIVRADDLVKRADAAIAQLDAFIGELITALTNQGAPKRG